MLFSLVALLLPPDHTKRECLAGLRQPGLDLLSHCSANPPEEKTERTERKIPIIYEGWGRPYKELRGRKKKANYIKLSTGKVRIQPKTDCWLTFRDYLKLTEYVAVTYNYYFYVFDNTLLFSLQTHQVKARI